MTGSSTDVDSSARATLNSFVVRAMRVEAHSLASDRVVLHRLAQMTFTVQVDPANGTAALIQEYPPEEQVESAAARVRPLILERDPTFYAHFFKAAGYFLHSAAAPDEIVQELRALKKTWATIRPDGAGVRGYYLERSTADSSEWRRATDNQLGFAWIYGDVVHSDADRLAQTKLFGVAERFRAAVPLVAHIMMLTIATLNFARQLHRDGLLPLEDGIFETPVTVAELVVRREGRVYLAEPVDAGEPIVLPPVGQGFGEGWTPIHQALVSSATGPENDRNGDGRLHVQILDPAGAVLAAVDLDRIEWSQHAEQVRVVLEEANQVFQVEDHYDLAVKKVTRTVRLTGLEGQPAGAVLPALRFLNACHTPNVGRVSVRGMPPEQGVPDPAWALDDFQQALKALGAAVEALATIEQHTAEQILVPDLNATDPREVGQWLFAAQLVRGEEVTATYPEGQYLLAAYDDDTELPDHGTFEIRTPLAIFVGGHHLDVGTSQVQLTDATLVGRHVHQGRTLHAFTTPDRHCRYRLAGRGDDV